MSDHRLSSVFRANVFTANCRLPTADCQLRYATWCSPLGPIVLWASPHGLVRLEFADRDDQRIPNWLGRHFGVLAPSQAPTDDVLLSEAVTQLDAYFAGERRAFELLLDLRGTPFQLSVWHALLAIPWGITRSYGALAQEIGHPKAVRAVGAANGANPISVIVPCHRLVASDGSLRAYGGGLERKQRLLALEGAHAVDSPSPLRLIPFIDRTEIASPRMD